jgi:hypothetical protein
MMRGQIQSVLRKCRDLLSFGIEDLGLGWAGHFVVGVVRLIPVTVAVSEIGFIRSQGLENRLGRLVWVRESPGDQAGEQQKSGSNGTKTHQSILSHPDFKGSRG